jgi:hypothetical protein
MSALRSDVSVGPFVQPVPAPLKRRTPTAEARNVNCPDPIAINGLGITLDTPIAALHGGSERAPSPALQLGDTLSLWVPGTSLNLGLVFSSPGRGEVGDRRCLHRPAQPLI